MQLDEDYTTQHEVTHTTGLGGKGVYFIQRALARRQQASPSVGIYFRDFSGGVWRALALLTSSSLFLRIKLTSSSLLLTTVAPGHGSRSRAERRAGPRRTGGQSQAPTPPRTASAAFRPGLPTASPLRWPSQF